MPAYFIRRLFTQLAEEVNTTADLIGCLQPKPPVVVKNIKKGARNLESLGWLHSVAPCFPVKADQIQIIHEPCQFYKILMERSSLASKRIVLASLYLGTGEMENAFVQVLRRSMEQQGTLRVNVLLDFTRGTRGSPNSKTMLLPLVQDFEERMQLSLYHTPDLRGMTKRLAPPRWNELLGLQHMKVYLFDNTVLVSGANLSNDYFTNRQDRYILIEDEALADFYAQLVERVQEFSLVVRQDAEVGLHRNWKILPYEGTKEEFIKKARESISSFIQEVYSTQRRIMEETLDADTWIFPLVEMGQIGIHHDSIVTKQILSSAIDGSRFKLATGYFNLTQEYMDTIANNCVADCSILMAHPNANGFQGAKGPAGGIPAAYTLIARKFYQDLQHQKQEHRVHLLEFEKPGWTYHAKGLWYYLPKSDSPIMTLIGSSNFGERSVNRDLETQICLVTSNEKLERRLQDEVNQLFNFSKCAEEEITSRIVPRWIQAVVSVFRNFF